MLDEIETIKIPEKTKKALIIDKEVDFCLLIQFCLSKKNFEASITDNPTKCFSLIERERPELIVAERKMDANFENHLKEKIESLEAYFPQIIFLDTRPGEPEGAVIYTLKKDYYKEGYYRKYNYKKPQSFWEKTVECIKNLFK